MPDILTKDKKNHPFDPIHMFTDKFGGIESPRPQNIKIEENPKLFAIHVYAILLLVHCFSITSILQNQNYTKFLYII